MPKSYKTLDFFDVKYIPIKDLEKEIKKHKSISRVYNILKDKVFPELRDIGITPYIIPLPEAESGGYWSDFSTSYIEEEYKLGLSDFLEKGNYIEFTIFLTKDGKVVLDKPIAVQNYSSFGKNKKKVIEIFTSHLGKYYDWDGKNTRAMFIYY